VKFLLLFCDMMENNNGTNCCVQVFEAEAQGVDLALKLANKMNLRKILIETDCKLLVDALGDGEDCIDWRSTNIRFIISAGSSSFCSFVYVRLVKAVMERHTYDLAIWENSHLAMGPYPSWVYESVEPFLKL
ncbi:hypothetical protein Tco_1061130, partial [Tanacetum coccineum]